MKISIIGSGYVGLTTGAVFAEKGHDVLCIDKDINKINRLKKGVVDIYEPGLDEMVRRNLKKHRLSFDSSIEKACNFAKVIFLCLPTPPLPNGMADLSFIEEVARVIAGSISEYHLIVDKSTVPVKTGERVKQIIARYSKKGVDFDVGSNPEFLREGSALDDALTPDRIVVGVESKRAELIFRDLYKPFNANLVVTDINSAEIIKHAANSFLALKISFINSVAKLCDTVGADVKVVAKGMGLDKRIGTEFLNAGIGYGGSCFSKDVNAFYAICRETGVEFPLLKEIENINADIRQYFVKKIQQELWIVKNKKIGVLGLAFKKDTDDIRNSVQIEVVKLLGDLKGIVSCYDPKAMKNAKKALKEYQNIAFVSGPYEVAKGADALAILTDWDEFRRLDYSKIRKLMKTPIIFDGRNILDPVEIKKAGFVYRGIGRGYYEKE
ncbi:MAG: UDP-glucose/GDP-mannose dehydrogenase family protein [Planctomycetes bacterium]|nr:UDP-glucose/GDP-mannose dehydrogenase family protein [Planctomycetota bacterium]